MDMWIVSFLIMSFPVVLMVAEKPSICNSIAKALSSDLTTRGKVPPVHEFTGTFKGKRVLYRVTSVTGFDAFVTIFFVNCSCSYRSYLFVGFSGKVSKLGFS